VGTRTPPTPTTILDATGHIAVDLPCARCRYNLRTLAVDGKCPECGHPVTETTAGYLPMLDREGRVADDLPCVSCGYNLRTLVATGICPECAAQVALSTRGHYLHLASPRWVKRLASGALLLIIALACAFVLPLAWLIFVFIISLVGAPLQGDIDAVWLGFAALAIMLAVVCIWLFVRGLLQLTAREPGARFRGEGLSARKLVRYGMLALPVLVLSGMFLPPLPGVVGITLMPFLPGFHAFLLLVAFMILALAFLRHIATLMRRIPRPGLVTFAKIEFWGGLLSGIVYVGSHVLLMIVSFRAFAPLAGGAGMPMTPYAAGPSAPGAAVTTSAPAFTSLGYTSTTVTYVGPGGVTTTASMPASMPMAWGPPAFGPLFFLVTTLTMTAGCATLIVGIAGLVLLILVWRALANAARLAEQNALPNTT
jgi:predicted RNA-binding Zn-ribbon protein involved in translation (DUF1610 family)